MKTTIACSSLYPYSMGCTVWSLCTWQYTFLWPYIHICMWCMYCDPYLKMYNVLYCGLMPTNVHTYCTVTFTVPRGEHCLVSLFLGFWRTYCDLYMEMYYNVPYIQCTKSHLYISTCSTLTMYWKCNDMNEWWRFTSECTVCTMYNPVIYNLYLQSTLLGAWGRMPHWVRELMNIWFGRRK